MNGREKARAAAAADGRASQFRRQPSHRLQPRDILARPPAIRGGYDRNRPSVDRAPSKRIPDPTMFPMSGDDGGGSKRDGKTEAKADSKDKRKQQQQQQQQLPMASFSELFSFFETTGTRALFAVGCFAGVLNGLVYPILAYLFSNSFSDLGGAADGMAGIRNVAFQFLVVGAYAFVVATVQTSCVEVAATRATLAFRKQWFAALLRQDAAFFDVHDVSGLASTVGSSATKVRRGLGRKFGEGVQFGTTFVGGIIYAFYASWRVALVVIGVLPFVSISALAVMKINQSQTARATKAYSSAGGVAYQAVSSIRTVLSLNSVPIFIKEYKAATMEAYRSAVSPLWKQGFVNGSMLGSFVSVLASTMVVGGVAVVSFVVAC